MNEGRDLVVWFTGLPASGKSTWAARLQTELRGLGAPVCLLDGDDIRRLVHPELGYSEQDRDLHYRSLAGLAGYIARQGQVVLVAATAHKREYRSEARRIAPRFLEVFVDAPLALCQQRDPKSLYESSEKRGLALPGAGITYEPPDRPDYRLESWRDDEQHLRELRSLILKASSG